MNTKAFEVLLHSQYAFDVCRNGVYEYEDCKQNDTPATKHPRVCKEKAKNVMACYDEA